VGANREPVRNGNLGAKRWARATRPPQGLPSPTAQTP